MEFDITIRRNDNTIFPYDDPIELVKNGYAYCFKEARLNTTIVIDIEHNKFCGEVSTFMRVETNKDGDLSSQFDNNNDIDNPIFERLADLQRHIQDTPQQKKLINNHIDANKGEIKGYI